MKPGSRRFLEELGEALGRHPEKADILAEYDNHLFEMMQENQDGEAVAYETIIATLGTPQEIADMWQTEALITPKKTQWWFVSMNISLFVAGALLTVLYHVYHWSWVDTIWARLTDIPGIIMVVYTLFWGLLGYEIGKEFGFDGFKLLKRTFLIALVPNLSLMYLVVFRIIPFEWFQPLLSFPFIMACIIFTGTLYPVSWLGYRWGKRASVQ